MDNLIFSNDLENIILNYKMDLEIAEKYKKCVMEIKNIGYIVGKKHSFTLIEKFYCIFLLCCTLYKILLYILYDIPL